ncbi:MAG: hypothetical protein JNL72_15130 [Flavipsychrobacter sp.]|nr:hypothetical protein [Flavipsychrobacter sp.]
MNWETHGDTTSLMIYDTVYQLCEKMELPLFHVTMLTEPREKQIYFGKNDVYRYGVGNNALVEVMERSLLYLKNLSTVAKKVRRDRFKNAKILYRDLTHKYKWQPRLRNEWLRTIKSNLEEIKTDENERTFYTPCPPGAEILKKLIPAVEEQEKMIPEVATFFKRMGIDVKIVFNCPGRNNVELKGITYFEDNTRSDYFDSVAKILKKYKRPVLVLIEPDIGIADFATTDVGETFKSYIYADEISQLQNSITKDSIIVVKETFHSPPKAKDKSSIYFSLSKIVTDICDNRTLTGLKIFISDSKVNALVETFISQNIRSKRYS